MKLRFTPARAAATGAAVLMACACGAGANSAKLLSSAGIGTTAKVTHSLMLGIGGLLVIYGLMRILRPAAYLAMAGLAALIAGAALTPPLVMTRLKMPWDGSQLTGAAFYVVFAVAVAYAFWRAFPSARPAASATALSGTALATGCTCCMVTGALAGMAVTAGGDPAIFLAKPLIYFTGIAIAAFGLTRMSGFRPLPWLLAGAVMTEFGGDTLKLTGDWMVGGVNLRFIPGYLIYLIGAGLVVKAWAVAYEPVRVPEVMAEISEPALRTT